MTSSRRGVQKPVLELTIDVPEGTPCEADVDDNGVVDGSDVARILGFWGQSNPAYDIDGSGLVDGGDLAVVLGEWGSCPE